MAFGNRDCGFGTDTPQYVTGIRAMPESDRPRERMSAMGPGSLHTRELLAIIIGSGGNGRSALDIADQLLGTDGIGPLAGKGIHELDGIPGMGPAKACQIVAAFELGRRSVLADSSVRPTISGPADVSALMMGEMRILDRESFRVLLLNTKNQVIHIGSISVGGLDSSNAHPREAFKSAIVRSAAHVIFVHNHPSGDPAPSDQDVLLTRRLREAGKILGIEVLDHIIIGDNRFVSLREKKGLWE